VVLDALARQWRAFVERQYPCDLPATAVAFLDALDRRAELLVVSGDGSAVAVEKTVRARVPQSLDLQFLTAEGLEYYPLKNYAARRAHGDLLLFMDSDVLPDEGWLAHLIGSFAQPEVDVVCAQTYVAACDLYTRAFALGWTYPLKDESGDFRIQPGKFYANTIAFRTEVFRQTEFPPVGRKTRGATAQLRKDFDRLGINIWENLKAAVDHPPPANLQHLVVRAIAHGRDHYMYRSERRDVHGLKRSLGLAATRFGRATARTWRDGQRLGLRPWEMPAALAITATYYGFFALGGLLTHVSPEIMGRRFRV
jgi:hypothetical protein